MANYSATHQAGDYRRGTVDQKLLKIVFPKLLLPSLQKLTTCVIVGIICYTAGQWMAETQLERMTPMEQRIYHRHELLKLQKEMENGRGINRGINQAGGVRE